jgi:hypothetical protein
LDQPDLLAVAGGIFAGLFGQVCTEPLGQLVDLLLLDTTAKVREVLDGLATGEVAVEGDVGGQVADAAADLERIDVTVQPEQLRAPRCGVVQVEKAADGGRLAGAVGPEEAEDLARTNLEAERIDGGEVAEVLAELIGRDGSAHSTHPIIPSWELSGSCRRVAAELPAHAGCGWPTSASETG